MTTQTFAAFMKIIGDLNQGVEETFNPERNRVSSQELFPFGKIARASASVYSSSRGWDGNQGDGVEQGERGAMEQRGSGGGGGGGEGDEVDFDFDADADRVRFAQTASDDVGQFRRKPEPRDIADALLPNRRHSLPPRQHDPPDRRQRLVGTSSSSSSPCSGKESSAIAFTESKQKQATSAKIAALIATS